MPEKEQDYWSENVGTPQHPESRLHEHAIALIWDKFRYATGEVRLPRIGGSLSDDLYVEGGIVVIPRDTDFTGGIKPDLKVLNPQGHVEVIVEVIVTSAPDREKEEKLRRLQRQGIRVALVTVKDESDLRKLAENQEPDKPVYDGYRDRKKDWRFSADEEIGTLVQKLQMCSPHVRETLALALRGLDAPESTLALSRGNPLRGKLGFAEPS